MDFACAGTAQQHALTLHAQDLTWMQTRFVHLQHFGKHSKILQKPTPEGFIGPVDSQSDIKLMTETSSHMS